MAMNKKKKKILKVSRIIGTILLVFSILFLFIVTYCNALPTKYLIILYLVISFYTYVTVNILYKKKFRSWLKVISNFISIIVILIYIIGLFYIQKTYDFIDKIGSRGYITETYYIVTNNDYKYDNIEDIKNIDVGTYVETIDLYNKMLEEYNKKVGSNLIEYKAVDKMARDLMNDKISAAIFSSAHKETLDTDLENFKDSTKIVDEIKIKIKVVEKHTDVNVSKEVFTIFLGGSDSRGDITQRTNLDVNMLVTINPNTYEILLTSIPRDYYVYLHGITEAKDKLTHAGNYGINMSMDTVEDLLDIEIDHYVKVGFNTVIDIVDLIGGVDVYSDQTFTPWTNNKIKIKKGMNHMDGEMALAFSRERKTYWTSQDYENNLTGDRHRAKNQQDVLQAILNKITSSTKTITAYTDILDKMSNSFETSLNTDDIVNLFKLQLDKMPKWNIKSYNLDGFDCEENQYVYTYGFKAWVMYPNEDTVKKASKYINGMKDGEKFSDLGIK